jgi:hypothetical protein
MEMTKGKTPHDVEVFAYDEMNGNMVAILSKNIWVEYLLRQHTGYGYQTFLSFYADAFDNIKNTEKMLKRLYSEETLWLNVKLFHFDLTNFNNEISASRLVTDKIFFMSDYYFTDADREFLLSFPTSTGLSLQRHMELFLQGKLEDNITELCSSHDLAPVIAKVFGIRKGYAEEKRL